MCRKSVLIESRGIFKNISLRERIMRARLFAISGLIALVFGVLETPAVQAQGNCDRACLEGFVDTYLDAWIARDPKKLPLAHSRRCQSLHSSAL